MTPTPPTDSEQAGLSPPTPYYQRDGITIYHADCRDILPLLEPTDTVLTHPVWPNSSVADFAHIDAAKLLWWLWRRVD